MIDSTHVKAHRSASGVEGGANQLVGRSHGVRNTKIHAIGDAKGCLLTIMLTGGEAHDCPIGAELVLQTKPGGTLLGDKAYDSAELRASLKERSTNALIPSECNRNVSSSLAKNRYYERHWIKNAFCRLKGFRRVTTRYDKLAVTFAASVYLVAAVV